MDPSQQGVPIGCRSPRQRGPYSTPINSEDPWEQAVTLYRGLWLAVGHHLVRVQIETPASGIWNNSRPLPLREVLAGQSRCTIARPDMIEGYGHACLDLPISEELRVRWRTCL